MSHRSPRRFFPMSSRSATSISAKSRAPMSCCQRHDLFQDFCFRHDEGIDCVVSSTMKIKVVAPPERKWLVWTLLSAYNRYGSRRARTMKLVPPASTRVFLSPRVVPIAPIRILSSLITPSGVRFSVFNCHGQVFFSVSLRTLHCTAFLVSCITAYQKKKRAFEEFATPAVVARAHVM